MKKLLFFVFILSIQINSQNNIESFGTTIVCIGRNDTIWIGTDSRQKNLDLSTEKVEYYNDVCKLIVGKDIISVITGNSRGKSLLPELLNTNQSPLLKMEFYESIIIPIFEEEGKGKFNRNIYRTADTIKYFVHSIYSCIRISEKLFVLSYNYFPVVKEDSLIEVKKHHGGWKFTDEKPFFAFASGNRKYIEEIVSKIDNHFDTIPYFDVPLIINNLVSIECLLEPDSVGEPISIIMFTKDKIEWIQYGSCK